MTHFSLTRLLVEKLLACQLFDKPGDLLREKIPTISRYERVEFCQVKLVREKTACVDET